MISPEPGHKPNQPGYDGSEPKIGIIQLNVTSPDSLFHALDPSPMVGRDLDDDVEDYIVESARELPFKDYVLIIHVADELSRPAEADAISQAIRSYFRYRRDVQSRRLRLLMKQGRHTLAVGLVFLLVCGSLGLIGLQLMPAPFGAFLNEGLLIIGWVANWRPVEIFLYDWRPMRQQRDILAALGRMDVRIRSAQEDLGAG